MEESDSDSESDSDEEPSTISKPLQRRKSPYNMTEEKLKKRLQHENRGRYITQLCVAIIGI